MSLSELKEELAKLPEEHQAELSAYLEYLLEKRPPGFAADLGHKLSDPDRSRWVDLEQLKREGTD